MQRKYRKKVTSIHNSVQIWYKGVEGVKLSLDVNVWRLKKTFKRNIYLDFGLMIEDSQKTQEVFLYFPFEIYKECIFDLGKELEDPSILNGIFNENYVISTIAKDILVKEDGKADPIFSIYKLNIDNDINLCHKFSGTVMSFKVKSEPNRRYYRFRIVSDKYGTLFKKYKPKNSFFDSAFNETEVIDFRINEKRNQDIGLMEVLDDNEMFQIKTVNFFVMSPIQDVIESDGVNLVYKRQLENGNFWVGYLNCNYKRMSVYKCHTVIGCLPIEDFNCFCKISYRKSNIGTICLYLLVLCTFTILFNILANIAWLLLKPIFF